MYILHHLEQTRAIKCGVVGKIKEISIFPNSAPNYGWIPAVSFTTKYLGVYLAPPTENSPDRILGRRPNTGNADFFLISPSLGCAFWKSVSLHNFWEGICHQLEQIRTVKCWVVGNLEIHRIAAP